MVIGWIYSRDLFDTSWKGLHEVLPIVIDEESRMFSCVLSMPQWRVVIGNLIDRSYRIRTYTPDAGDHGELFWSDFGALILTPMRILRPIILGYCRSCFW